MINDETKKLLDNLETTLKDQILWSSRNHLTIITETVERARTLKQFVIGLSIAILSLVFPILINNDVLLCKDYFILSFIQFSGVTIIGLMSLISPTLRELIWLPKISTHHTEEVLKTLERVQEIKKLEDNSVAGQEFEKLSGLYKKLNLPNPNVVSQIIGKYDDLIFYVTFFMAFTILMIAIFNNLI